MEMMRPKAVSKTKANAHERSAEIDAGSVTGRVIGRVINWRRINHDGRWLRIIINRRWPRHGGGVNRRRTINRWRVRHGRVINWRRCERMGDHVEGQQAGEDFAGGGP